MWELRKKTSKNTKGLRNWGLIVNMKKWNLLPNSSLAISSYLYRLYNKVQCSVFLTVCEREKLTCVFTLETNKLPFSSDSRKEHFLSVSLMKHLGYMGSVWWKKIKGQVRPIFSVCWMLPQCRWWLGLCLKAFPFHRVFLCHLLC